MVFGFLENGREKESELALMEVVFLKSRVFHVFSQSKELAISGPMTRSIFTAIPAGSSDDTAMEFDSAAAAADATNKKFQKTR